MSPSLVLCYHAVSPTWPAPLSIRPEELRRQLTWLRRLGWRGTTFGDLVSTRDPGKRLAVTFDDAFLSVRRYARPILDDLGMPATVFAPTAFMDERQPLHWPGVDGWGATEHAHELESMSWDDLGELAAAGWEIGAHTRTHPLLTRVDAAHASAELRESRADVERALGIPCRSIAYPYGGVDGRVATMARDAGYAAGAALSSSLRHHGAHWWPRLGVYHSDDWRRFLMKANPVTRAVRRTPWWPDSTPESVSPGR